MRETEIRQRRLLSRVVGIGCDPGLPIARRGPHPQAARAILIRVSNAAPSPTCDAERFDPPVTRVVWRLERSLGFSELVVRLRAALGDARVERLLEHRGLQLDGRPVGWEDAPPEIAAETRVIAWALDRDPDSIAVGRDQLIFDEDGVVAVAKPAWLPVQGTRASQTFSLEARLRALLGCPELRAVHRLDRETSGVVLFARSAAVASALGRALAARRIRRRYLAVVSPVPEAAFEVAGDMVRLAGGPRFRFGLASAPLPGARPSHTRFERARVRGSRALLVAEPTTGRTHQIRVHLAARGTPIVGDRVYGRGPVPGAPRCLLHARWVEIPWPAGGSGRREVEAPVPEDFGAAGFPAGT